MMNSVNKFWMEHKGHISSGSLALAITLAMMTMRYVKYFLF